VATIPYSQRVPSAQKRVGYKSFPPPYPNGWVFVGGSDAVPKGRVLPLDVCGRQLVAFRDEQGTLSVLDAYCSHMGTHLGYGGYVSDGCVVCPYHQWAFNGQGALTHIPYSEGNGHADCARTRNHLKAYYVVERHGMMFVWLHADDADPWDLTWYVDTPTQNRCRFVTRHIDQDYLMHPMEPTHNTVDWYHFQTVHSTLGQHWLSWWKWIRVDQTIKPPRMNSAGSLDDDGTPIKQKDVMITDELIKGISLLNGLIRLPKWMAERLATTQVRMSGPLLVVFRVDLALFGTLILLMPLTPTAPFVTHTEYWVFAGPSMPSILARVLARAMIFTVNQDREVWEHRVHVAPRNTVKGDFNPSRYDRWLQGFYSESSVQWDSPDLSW